MGTFYNDSDNYYLAHYGVLGMKWGRRKQQLTPEQENRLKAYRKASRRNLLRNTATAGLIGTAGGAAISRRYGSRAALKGAVSSGLSSAGLTAVANAARNSANSRLVERAIAGTSSGYANERGNNIINNTVRRDAIANGTPSSVARLNPTAYDNQGRVTSWSGSADDFLGDRRRRRN